MLSNLVQRKRGREVGVWPAQLLASMNFMLKCPKSSELCEHQIRHSPQMKI